MAFSTQKDFVTPTFERPPVAKQSEAHLKSYESCFDTRAWALDSMYRSKYLADVVHRMRVDLGPPGDGSGDGGRFFTREELERLHPDQLIQHILELYENIKSKNCELKGTATVLKDASKKFASISKILDENKELQRLVEREREKAKGYGDQLLETTHENDTLKKENSKLKGKLKSKPPDEEICELRRKSETLDRMLAAREELMEQMKKNMNVEGAMMSLAEKAKMADRLMQENQQIMQACENLKNEMEENNPSAKMKAENRMLQDRIAEVETLEEEIALYKARCEMLNRKVNDLKQKIIEYHDMEQELSEYRQAFARKEAEVRDCEENIGRLVMTVEAQTRESERNKHRLKEYCKLQADVAALSERFGMEFIDETQICAAEPEMSGPKRSITGKTNRINSTAYHSPLGIPENDKLERKDFKTEDTFEQAAFFPGAADPLKENTELRKTIAELEKEISELQSQLKKCLKQNDAGNSKTIAELETKLKECQEKATETQPSSNQSDEIAALRSQIEAAKEELKQEKMKSDKVIEELKSVQVSNVKPELNETTTQCEEKLREMRDASTKCEADLKEAETQCAAKIKEATTQCQEQLQEEKIQWEREKQDLETMIEKLKNESRTENEVKLSCDELKNELEKHRVANTELLTELQNAKNKIEDLTNAAESKTDFPVVKNVSFLKRESAKNDEIDEIERLQTLLDSEMVWTKNLWTENQRLLAELASYQDKISRLSLSDPEKQKLRHSYESELHQRDSLYDAKINEMQNLHEEQLDGIRQTHALEMESMRVQLECLHEEINKINERCKCGLEKPTNIYGVDERLMKICRDAQEFGLEPITYADLKYLQDLLGSEILRKEAIAKYGEDITQNLDKALKEIQDMVKDSEKRVECMRMLSDMDEVPTKLPSKPFKQQPSPLDTRFRRGQSTTRKSQGKTSSTSKTVNRKSRAVSDPSGSMGSSNPQITVIYPYTGNNDKEMIIKPCKK